MLQKNMSKDAIYLKDLRVNKLHISQEELADRLGISKQFISLVENGKSSISKKIKEKISKIFPEHAPVNKIVFPNEYTSEFSRKFRKEYNLTQEELAKLIGRTREFICSFEGSNKILDASLYSIIKNKYSSKEVTVPINNLVKILYRPDVYLSAGYGVTSNIETPEYTYLDRKLFVTDKCLSINPQHCEIVSVYGDSMLPEYRHGDKVLIDKSVTEFIDGQIFAFIYDGQAYIKEIGIANKRIKCIPLNDKYDAFYIEPNIPYRIIGRVVPRVRL